MTPAYAELMHTQIEALKLGVNDRVVDLGSGTGAFPYYLHENSKAPKQVLVVECDFVKGALTRAQERIGHHASMSFVETDLGLGQRASNFPFQSGSVQGLIASLFLSYVQDPATLLPEMYRIVAPGGRVVVSSLRRDADMSKLFVDAIPHLREKWSRDLATWAGGVPFETAIRAYLNEASRLLDFEESGQFTFWDGTQLERMLRRAGFIEIEVNEAFGSPPQAIVVSGQKPD
jgi:ubiquinone/menaquinone biosynthesis C-methylase UbiE